MAETETVVTSETPAPFYLTVLWACNLIWTLILLGMNIAEFLQKGQWVYQGPGSLIYFATLAAYAGTKETHQWAREESRSEMKGRKGILFVVIWLFLSMVAFVLVNLGQGYVFPHELLTINLEVLGIFFGTQASRAFRKGRGKASKNLDLEEAILKSVKETGGAGSSFLCERLGAGRNEVQYALRKLVKEGRLRKIGESTDPDTKYEAV